VLSRKVRPPLGIGGLLECVSLSVSFSHRRVGSSILASLSEAGGNESKKVPSKPLPPRSTLFPTRHVKRTPAPSNARVTPMSGGGLEIDKLFISNNLNGSVADCLKFKFVPQFQYGTDAKLIREGGCFGRELSTWRPLRRSSRTTVTRFSGSTRYRFFGASLSQSLHAQPLRQWFAASKNRSQNCYFVCLFSCRIDGLVGEHASCLAGSQGGNLLLPLRGGACAPQLREDVRIAEVCGAEVGDELREAADQAAHEESGCRAAISASRTQRASASREARQR